MNNIQRTLDAIQTFNELSNIAENSNPTLSLWGNRAITVQGCEGTLPLDALTKKALELLVQNPGYAIDHAQHYASRLLVRRCIDLIYDKSDRQVRTSNCFTKLLTMIRSYRLFGPNCSPLRWIWREIEGTHSDTLSLRQAITKKHIAGLGEIRLYLDDPADYSFWWQLRDDFYWNVIAIL